MDKRRLLVRLLQLNIKARLAHSACFATVALQEMTTAGRTIELRAVRRTAVRGGGHFLPTLDALLTDDSVALDAESGHLRLPALFIRLCHTSPSRRQKVLSKLTGC
jgi:hypothetical protein